MKTTIILLLGMLAGFALVAVALYLVGPPRDLGGIVYRSGQITLIAYPAGMAVALLLLRRRKNGQAR